MTSREIDEAVRGELRGQQSHEGHASIYTLDERLLHELKPDLILTQELCDVCAVSYKTVSRAARMFETEIPIVSLEPTTITDILDTIRTVGKFTNREQAAEAVVQDLAIRIDNLAAKLADVERRPRTLMLEWLEPPFAPGHWVPEQVALAGGDATFGAAGKPSTETTAEAIKDYAPEVIVLVPCGYYIEDILRELETARLPSGWSELPAVKNNQVWVVDATSYFSRPGPRVVDGAEILASILHPEFFGEPSEAQAVRVPTGLMRAHTI
jgi:iron complex transport system substrate-binding protein